MALAPVKEWVAAEVLYAADLVAEFANIYDNPISLVSPWTGSMDAGGFDLTALDELAFSDADADASAVGRLRRTDQHLEWHDATGSWPLQGVVGGGIHGLTLSNNGTDATNDIDIAAGQAVDDSETYVLRLASALTKRLDSAWAVGTGNGGLDTGSIADTTYFVWLIKRSDTGVTDVLFSASASAPTMPTNYDFKRRIGAILRESSAIVAFTQTGDEFIRTTVAQDVSDDNPGTSAVTRTLSVPIGIVVDALIMAAIDQPTTTVNARCYLSPLTSTDETPGITTGIAQLVVDTAGGTNINRQAAWGGSVRTNTSGQIRSRLSASDANTILAISTRGWIDRRGRDS